MVPENIQAPQGGSWKIGRQISLLFCEVCVCVCVSEWVCAAPRG